MQHKQRPIILGIVGDSAAGKTTISADMTYLPFAPPLAALSRLGSVPAARPLPSNG